MYAEGRGVHQDDTEAVQWFRQAAEQGNALGQYHLGLSYAEGVGLDKDDSEAMHWLKKAAEQGFTAAQDYLQQVEAL